jgi:hypothetical protein
MDERKHPISPNELNLRPASGWTSAVVDSPSANLAKSDDFVAREQQRHSRQVGPCRNDSSDGPSVAVYYRNEEEVSEGLLTALIAMGVARVQFPEPVTPPAGEVMP